MPRPSDHHVAFSDKTEYAVLDPLSELDLSPDIYGAFYAFGLTLFVSYAVISGILLGNLLIAIITNRYK